MACERPLNVIAGWAGIHGFVPCADTLVFRYAQNDGVQLVASVIDCLAQRRFPDVICRCWLGKMPYLGNFVAVLLCLGSESKTHQYGVTVPAKRLEKLFVQQRNPRLALGWIQGILEIGVEVVGAVHSSCHGVVGALACYLFRSLPSPSQLCLVRQSLDILVGQAGWLQVKARRDWTLRRGAAEGIRSRGILVAKPDHSVLLKGLLVDEMVQEVLGIPLLTDSAVGAAIAEVHHDIDVPPTRRTVGGDFVIGRLGGLLLRRGDLGLVGLEHEGVSAVAVGHSSGGGSVWVVMGRRRGEEVPASAVFVAGIVCEQVLEQPRRCLACAAPWLAESVDQAWGSVPGAMAAMHAACGGDDSAVDVSGAALGRRLWRNRHGLGGGSRRETATASV